MWPRHSGFWFLAMSCEPASRRPLVCRSSEAHLDRLAVLAGLHDFGKTSKGFQDKLLGPSIAGHTGHVSEALALLLGSPHDVRDALGVELLSEWFKPVDVRCLHGRLPPRGPSG